MSVAGLYNCIDSLSRFSCILFTTEFYVILYGLRLEASHLSLWRGVIISYSIHGCIAADWRSCSVLAVSLVFIVRYGIGIFRFRFLFCWYVLFFFYFFFSCPVACQVGGGFSRSVPSLCSRVYFMYTSYFVRGHLLYQQLVFTIVVVGAMAV